MGAGIVATSAFDAIVLPRAPLPSRASLVLAPLLLPPGAPIAPQGGTGLVLASRF